MTRETAVFRLTAEELARARRINASARRAMGGQTANGKGAKLRRLDVARMHREEPPPVPWVVEGLVVRGMLTVLNGREGEGKSLLAMALAAGVLTGQSEGGLACHQGRVVIVDAENGEREIHRRVRTLELPAGEIEVFEAQGFDLRKDSGELESALEAHRPDLLVLDSYRTLWGGEENDSGEVAAVLDPLRNLVRRFGAGALLLHHSGKVNGAYRGSSAIGASAELGFTLARSDADPEDSPRRYLATWKCRPAEKPPRRWLRLSVEAGRVFIDEADAPEEEEPTKPAPVAEELTPRVLAALAEAPQALADVARGVGYDPKNRSVRRVLGALLEAGKAEKVGPENRPGWKVSPGATPIGRDTATPSAQVPANPHARAESEGVTPVDTFGADDTSRNGWTPDAEDHFTAQVLDAFPGAHVEHPRSSTCECRQSARSPRANGPDHCQNCKRPTGEGGAA